MIIYCKKLVCEKKNSVIAHWENTEWCGLKQKNQCELSRKHIYWKLLSQIWPRECTVHVLWVSDGNVLYDRYIVYSKLGKLHVEM